MFRNVYKVNDEEKTEPAQVESSLYLSCSVVLTQSREGAQDSNSKQAVTHSFQKQLLRENTAQPCGD